MFGDLDSPLNASHGLSAIAEFLFLVDLITSQVLGFRDYKQRNFLNSVDDVTKFSRFANKWTAN